jgi:hypothetical protein
VLLEQEGNLIAFAVSPAIKSDTILKYVRDGKEKGFWGGQDGYVFEDL